jgi:hypothetical protein
VIALRRSLSLLAAVAVTAGLYAAVDVPPASAELGCPNDMTLTPAALVRQGTKKDKNANTFICAKPTTCLQSSGVICQGGPDDQLYGGPPLLGNDGEWYYVVDDV